MNDMTAIDKTKQSKTRSGAAPRTPDLSLIYLIVIYIDSVLGAEDKPQEFHKYNV